MSTRVWNSAILGAPIESVWKLVRCMRFDYHPAVRSATFCQGDADQKMTECGVGYTGCIEYKDGTTQRLRMMALSDADHSVSWDLTASTPDGSMPFLGASHTIQLRRVTQDNSTFIEWSTIFSKASSCFGDVHLFHGEQDIDTNALMDASFKQKEHFGAIFDHLRRTARQDRTESVERGS